MGASPVAMPVESLPPFAIIVGAMMAMGGIQYAAQHGLVGKPKPVQWDTWDRHMDVRDAEVLKVRAPLDARGGRARSGSHARLTHCPAPDEFVKT